MSMGDSVRKVSESVRSCQVAAPQVRPGAQDWSDDARLAAFWNGMLARLGASPGTTAAGAASIVPLSQDYSCDEISDPARPVAQGPGDCAETRIVAGAYFDSAGQALLQGRAFSDALDRVDAPATIILSRSAAQKYWPDGDALGHEPGRAAIVFVSVLAAVGAATLVIEPGTTVGTLAGERDFGVAALIVLVITAVTAIGPTPQLARAPPARVVDEVT